MGVIVLPSRSARSCVQVLGQCHGTSDGPGVPGPPGSLGPPGPVGPPGPGEPPFYYDVVRDFGADPTGVIDASPAINAAIATASGAGLIRNRVYIPPGSYRIGSTIQHLPNVAVFGTGPNTILRTDIGVSAWDFATGFLRAELSDLQILGNFGAAAPFGVNLDQSQRCYLHDLQIWDFQIGIVLSSGGVFSAYNTIGENVEVNRSTAIGIQALANANGNRIVGSRIFFTHNATSSAIGLDVADAQVLEVDDVQIEGADYCLRARNNTGIFNLNVHDCYFEPGTNPTTGVVGACYDILLSNLFDGIETLYLRNNAESASRGTIDVPPEMLVETDGYSRAYYGARFSGTAVPKRNYVYNGQILYYGLPSVLPGWGLGGVAPTLSSNPLHVTGNRSLQATSGGPTSSVAVGFTVSDDGVDWVTCGIRYQIVAGNIGFTFTATIGGNSRQYQPEPTPTDVWREAWVTVPVDPANRSGAISFVVDSVNGTGTILIDEAWAVPGKYAISSTQYGERIQSLPAPILIVDRPGVSANEAFGPIDILTLPATLAPPLDDFSTAPTGVVGCILRTFIQCTSAPPGLLVNAHSVYVNIPASGTVVPASYEFNHAVYSGEYQTKDIVVRATSIGGGYNAADGYTSNYNVALIAWILG